MAIIWNWLANDTFLLYSLVRLDISFVRLITTFLSFATISVYFERQLSRKKRLNLTNWWKLTSIVHHWTTLSAEYLCVILLSPQYRNWHTTARAFDMKGCSARSRRFWLFWPRERISLRSSWLGSSSAKTPATVPSTNQQRMGIASRYFALLNLTFPRIWNIINICVAQNVKRAVFVAENLCIRVMPFVFSCLYCLVLFWFMPRNLELICC